MHASSCFNLVMEFGKRHLALNAISFVLASKTAKDWSTCIVLIFKLQATDLPDLVALFIEPAVHPMVGIPSVSAVRFAGHGRGDLELFRHFLRCLVDEDIFNTLYQFCICRSRTIAKCP